MNEKMGPKSIPNSILLSLNNYFSYIKDKEYLELIFKLNLSKIETVITIRV
jgi:hypothetical protein